MSNIDTRVTVIWGKDHKAERSNITTVANQILQIRRWYNEEFRRVIREKGGSIYALKLRREEDQSIASALRRHGWTYGTLEAEIERRTTARWARYVIHGWF